MSGYRTTAKDKSIDVHIFRWNGKSVTLPDFGSKVISARLLAGGRPFPFGQTEPRLEVRLPVKAPDPNVSVVALETYYSRIQRTARPIEDQSS